MGVDAIAALLFGRLFDRSGIRVMVIAAMIGAGFPPLVFLGGNAPAIVGVAMWGGVLGVMESVMRAAVSELAPPDRRGSAFGVFHACFGLTWFLGSAALGLLYDYSIPGLILCSSVLQLASIPLFLQADGALRRRRLSVLR